mgnify:FL=1
MEERKVFWRVNWATAIGAHIVTHDELANTLRYLADEIVGDLDPNDHMAEWNSINLTIEPVLMTQSEFDALPDL